MPFNSSTPKIDGYYNSSILTTAKNSAGISQMRRLSSGWGQACASTLITGNSSQPDSRKYCTYILFTALSLKTKTKTKPHTANTVLFQKSMKDPTPNWNTIPTDEYLHYSQRIQNSSFIKMQKQTEKLLCFSLLLHSIMTINRKKDDYIHSLTILTSSFKTLQYGSRQTDSHYTTEHDKMAQDQDRRDTKWDTQGSLTAFQFIWRFAYELLIHPYYYISE